MMTDANFDRVATIAKETQRQYGLKSSITLGIATADRFFFSAPDGLYATFRATLPAGRIVNMIRRLLA